MARHLPSAYRKVVAAKVLAAGLLMVVWGFPVARCFAAAEDIAEETSAETTEAEAEDEQPIAVELAQGINLLTEQIEAQEALLKSAQTEREQRLIRNHIRLLHKERRSLESLLERLVGPEIDILEETRERQRERWEQKEELIRDRQQ
jgi:hypothetical protein